MVITSSITSGSACAISAAKACVEVRKKETTIESAVSRTLEKLLFNSPSPKIDISRL
jgi:hypothetical protein